MRCLFVDDDEYRFELVQMLGKVPAETVQVSDYRSAIAALTIPVDVMYLEGDLKDYNGNGVDVARWVVANSAEVKHTIIHSANPDMAERMGSILENAGYSVAIVDLDKLPRGYVSSVTV